jgi:hypothetical protein
MAKMLAYLALRVTTGGSTRGRPARYTTRDRPDTPESEVPTVTDSGPKSAYELAMERLRQKDKEGGIVERSLTADQKTAIAEARRVYEAKVAEREILHRDALRHAKSMEELQKLNEEFARDRDRYGRDRDRKIAEIREIST